MTGGPLVARSAPDDWDSLREGRGSTGDPGYQEVIILALHADILTSEDKTLVPCKLISTT